MRKETRQEKISSVKKDAKFAKKTRDVTTHERGLSRKTTLEILVAARTCWLAKYRTVRKTSANGGLERRW